MKTGERDGGDLIQRLQAGAQAHRRPQKTRKCPDEDRLRLLLPGQLEPEEADKLLTHAAECDWCGTVLREAAQDLSEPPTGEEEELAGKARLADPRSRRELVERIVKRRRDWWSPIFLRWVPAAGLAALLLAGGVSYQAWARGPAHTERLLAEASSSLHEPRELADANSNISRAIEAHPDDPKWLQLEGRADLLGGKEDAAITELERAHALRPGDASILLDWGTALFQRADAQGRAEAFERLSEGVRLQPNDPALLFNQALAAQMSNYPNEARDDWEKYLRVDSTSGWAQEARQHLEEVKKNLNGSGPIQPRQPRTH